MNNVIASTSSKALEHIYREGKDFILIALTGRTGSGCSTSAQILSSNNLELPEQGYDGITENELRKFKIIKKYLHNNGSHSSGYKSEQLYRNS